MVSALKIRDIASKGIVSKSVVGQAALRLSGVLLAVSLSLFWGQTQAATSLDASFFALSDQKGGCVGTVMPFNGMTLQVLPCNLDQLDSNMLFAWNDDGGLTLKSKLGGPSTLCINTDRVSVGKDIILRRCSGRTQAQGWGSESGSSESDDEGIAISHTFNPSLCLDGQADSSARPDNVELQNCDENDDRQRWALVGEDRGRTPKLVVLFTIDGGRFSFPFDKAKEARLDGHSVYSGYGRQPEGGYDKFFKEGTVFDYALYEHAGVYTPQGKMTVMTGGNSWSHGNNVHKLYSKGSDGNYPASDCFDATLYPSIQNNLINATVNQDEAIWVCTSPKKFSQAFTENDYNAITTIIDSIYKKYGSASKLYGVGPWDTPLIQMMGNAKMSGAKTFWMNRYFSEGRKSSMTSSKYYFPDGSLPAWVDNFTSYYDFLKTQLPFTINGSQFLWETHRPITSENYENAAAHQANNPNAVPLNYSTNGVDYQLQGDVFPHTFANDERTAINLAVGMPQGDAYVLEFAAELVKQEQLGEDNIPDFLVVDLTSPDQIAHTYGTDSVEHEESWYLLDKALGRFMKTLEDKVGKENLLLVLTADHGFDSVPEWVNSGSAEPNTEKFYMGMNYHVQGPQALRDEARRMYLEPKTINGERVDVTKLVNDAFEAVTGLSLAEGDSVVVGYNAPMIRVKPDKITKLLRTLPSTSRYNNSKWGFIRLVGAMVAHMNQNKANHHHVEQFYSSVHLILKPWESLPPQLGTRDKAPYFERAAKLATSHRSDRRKQNGFYTMTNHEGAAGEIVIIPKPHTYFYDGEGYSAMHSGPYWWDQSVMLMFWGGVPSLRVEQLKYPMRQRQMVRVRDIVPTLGALMGLPTSFLPVPGLSESGIPLGRPIPQVLGAYDEDNLYRQDPSMVDDMENAPLDFLGPPSEYWLLGNRENNTQCLKAVSERGDKLEVANCDTALGDREAYWTYMDDYPLYNNNGSFQSFASRMYALDFDPTNSASSSQGPCMHFAMKRKSYGFTSKKVHMRDCSTKERGGLGWRHYLYTSNIGLSHVDTGYWTIRNQPSFPGLDDQCLKDEGRKANLDSHKCSPSRNDQHWNFFYRE